MVLTWVLTTAICLTTAKCSAAGARAEEEAARSRPKTQPTLGCWTTFQIGSGVYDFTNTRIISRISSGMNWFSLMMKAWKRGALTHSVPGEKCSRYSDPQRLHTQNSC